MDKEKIKEAFREFTQNCGANYEFPDDYVDHMIPRIKAFGKYAESDHNIWNTVFQDDMNQRTQRLSELFNYIMEKNLDSKYDAEAMNWVVNQVMMGKKESIYLNGVFADLLYEYDVSHRIGMTKTSGHLLEIGDHVIMDIQKIGEEDLDGVEITQSGDNYWKYMNEHPQEVYEVIGFDFETDCDHTTYILSGAMAGNNWYSEELILLPEPRDNFEELKNVTNKTAPEFIFNMIHELCEDGMASKETIAEWLNKKI